MVEMVSKRWVFPPHDPDLHQRYTRELGLQASTASVLVNRGICTMDAARSFLNPSISDLLDPWLLNEMDRAVSRIQRAIRQSERIVIYGDYDVDGITATTLFMEFFKSKGVVAHFYIPDRLKEGYGLNPLAIRELQRQGTNLMITVDCGTTSVDEIRLARSLGMDVIVTDHHEVPEELPPATALINPKRRDGSYPEMGLCTAGLVFKIIQALDGDNSTKGLDLVALGTIADVSPLTGENRFLVKEGLKQLTEGLRPGIQALKEVSGLKEPVVRAGTVGFTLAPRINAAGRLADASLGVRLLMTQSMEEARHIAQLLNHHNQERRLVEGKILEEALCQVESELDLDQEWGIVLASRNWHPGVIGIVASRLVERYCRPTILLAIDADGLAKGSARSISGFHLVEGLRQCGDLLTRFGGHQAAAGLALHEKQISAFRKRFSSQVKAMTKPENFQPRQVVDAMADWDELHLGLVDEWKCLAPFGPANPEPTLMLKDVAPIRPRIVGNDHIKFTVRKKGSRGDSSIEVIGFRMGDRFSDFKDGMGLDLAFTPERNCWNGREQIQLRLKDIRPSTPGV